METKDKAKATPQATDEGPSIDPMEVARYVWLAARRNVITCILVGLLTLGLGLAAVSAVPRTYESTSKVYVTNIGAITTQLTSGRRPFGEETALRDLRELIFTHPNLTAIVRNAHLVENWPKTRNWLQRLIDQTRAALRGPTPKQYTEDMLVAMLETMIDVRAEDSSSIRFKAQWRDPWSAQALTKLVQQNYVASKEVEELAAITRATTVLEDELRRADDAFEPAVTALKKEIAKVRDRARTKVGPAGAPAPRTTTAQDIVTAVVSRPSAPPVELTTKLNEIRNEERAVLEPWQRRAAELKFQLADLRAVYGPAHPAVLQLEAKLKAASAEPVELLDIRQREAELKASMASWAVAGATTTGVVTSRRAQGDGAAAADPVQEVIMNVADDPSLAPARIEVETVLRKAADMRARLDGARMELALAQVSFRYQYRQVEPARFYAKPIKPKIPALIAGAIAAALVIGFLAGAGREVISGKIMETWQVKNLGLDVIATVDVRAWQLPATRSGRTLPPPRRPD